MLKVMHVLCMPTFSGAENVAITLIKSLKDKVYSVYVSPDGPIRDVVTQNGIEHYAIKKVDVKNIRRAIAETKPDIIHAHDFRAGMVCTLAAGRIPVVNHLHNNAPWIRKPGVKSLLYGLTCFRYNKILTVSDSVMDEYVFGKFLTGKSIVVGNPIDVKKIREKAEEETNGELLALAKTDVVFLGRLSPQKNIFFLLQILKEIKEKKPDVTLSVIGTGELREEFERRIEEEGLRDNVVLFGFHENPYPLLKQAKVMCMPSKFEGFGLAAAEALALGIPVVAANVGGLTTIVNELCGKLCNAKQEYVDEIYELLTDGELMEKKSTAALAVAMRLDNLSSYSESVLKVYEEVTGAE